jgi:hypothetical protein
MFMTKEYWWAITIILALSIVQTYVISEWETDAEIMEYTK